ncbi:hypothetical protein CPC08DRAFT_631508 [Agrocybe pediades]|nr:hypothetical protein CPC08DRAFT_631508 [Agrocybe pediades]
MTRNDLLVLDTVETSEYIIGELSDDELDIPAHMIPPNPDDSDILPSQVHPSYPYGNPTQLKHPSTRARPGYDPASRALFEDMGYTGGLNGTLRWRDLGLEELLPVDEEKEEAKRAIQARKMASGSSGQNPQVPQQHAAHLPDELGIDEEDEDEDDEENDENNNEDMDEEEEEEEEEELSEGDED